MQSKAMEWQFINTGYHNGEFNMQFDIDLAEKLLQGKIPPTLRVYGWKPWTVSLGYNQNENDINVQKCHEYGFDIVRRPTGGRAILHANELTYSVVMPAEDKSIVEVYSAISKALVAGLKKICAEIDYEKSQPNFQQFYREQESIPCFSRSARYEVQVKGRKLVGSAQRRISSPHYPEVVLQHGSILLGDEHKLLAEVLNVQNDIRAKIIQDMEHKTITLSAAAKKRVTFAESANAVKTGFEEMFGVTFSSPVEVCV